MVQVGCTINYGRSPLWKQTKELHSPSPERISILVGFPASVLSAPTQSLHVPGLFSAHSATFSLRPRRSKAFDWRRLSRFVFSSHREKTPPHQSHRVDYLRSVGENKWGHPHQNNRVLKWACGAAGSALPWHGRGRRFDPDQVHHFQVFTAFPFSSLVAFGSKPLLPHPFPWKR